MAFDFGYAFRCCRVLYFAFFLSLVYAILCCALSSLLFLFFSRRKLGNHCIHSICLLLYFRRTVIVHSHCIVFTVNNVYIWGVATRATCCEDNTEKNIQNVRKIITLTRFAMQSYIISTLHYYVLGK